MTGEMILFNQRHFDDISIFVEKFKRHFPRNRKRG